MKIVLGSDGSVELLRGERITRGQDLSRRIYVEWNENESPIDTGQMRADNMEVQLCITRPDGEQSGWYPMIKIDAEDKYYYILQAWDTVVAGIATVQVRWHDITIPEKTRPEYPSDEACFIVDNGKIAQPLNISSENYNNIMMLLTPLQANSLRKYDVKNLPNDVRYNADGEKTAPALYFNFEHEVSELCEDGVSFINVLKSGFLIPIVSNNIQTEFFITGDKLYTRRVTAEETTLFVNTMTSENIAKNTSKIEENTSKIEENTNAIEKNTSDIIDIDNRVSSNSGNIESLYGTVFKNVEDIASNSSKIQENTNAIASNASKIEKNTNNIKALFNLQLEKNVLAYDNAELTEELQQTGGAELSDLTILDNSYATVNKISGNTVKFSGTNLLDVTKLTSGNEKGGKVTVSADGVVTFSNFVYDEENEHSQKILDLSCLNGLVINPGEVYVLKADIVTSPGFGGMDSDIGMIQTTASFNGAWGTTFFGDWRFEIGNYTTEIQTFNDTFMISAAPSAEAFNGFSIKNLQLSKVVDGVIPDYEPYKPYFEGLKNAKISGIKSIGRNLIDVDAMLPDENTSPYFSMLSKNIDGSFTISKDSYPKGNSGRILDVITKAGTYTISYTMLDYKITNHTHMNQYSVTIRFGDRDPNNSNNLVNTTVATVRFSSGETIYQRGAFCKLSITIPSDKTVMQILTSAPTNGDYVTFKDLMLNEGSTPLPYIPYGVESTMQLPQTVELGKWDYIANGQIVKETSDFLTLNGSEDWSIVLNNYSNFSYFALKVGEFNSIVADQIICDKIEQTYISVNNLDKGINIINSNTNQQARITFRPFDETITTLQQLQTYLANNPLTVAYHLATPTYEPITFDNEYLVWDKGFEQVLTPKDENGLTCFDYGANTTEENSYYVLIGGNE